MRYLIAGVLIALGGGWTWFVYMAAQMVSRSIRPMEDILMPALPGICLILVGVFILMRRRSQEP
jgi:hypothetical protein